jgi:hypothetical protein
MAPLFVEPVWPTHHRHQTSPAGHAPTRYPKESKPTCAIANPTPSIPLPSRLRHSEPLTPSARSNDAEGATARACTVRSIAVTAPIFVDRIRCVNITVDASEVECTSVEPRQRQSLYLVNSRRTSTATASASPTDAAYPSIQVWVAARAGTVHPGGRSSIRQR